MTQYIRSGYEIIGGEPAHQTITISEEDEIVCDVYGYINDKQQCLIFYLCNIFLIGIPYIICCWYPQYKTLKYIKCPIRIAEIVLVTDNIGNNTIINVKTENANIYNNPNIRILRYFSYQHNKYIWDPSTNTFVPLEKFISPKSLTELLENTDGLCEYQQNDLLKLFGPNKVEIEVKSYWRLFVEEVFNPFYIFQAFSIILWCFDDYMLYAGCVLILTLFSAITSLIQTKKQSEALHNLVETSNTKNVQILRGNLIAGNTLLNVDPTNLVPGDLLVLPSTGCIMPCDAVLLSGHCIVNESMLTGESVPVIKTPPHASNELFDITIHKRHTLFSGTHLMQTRYYGDEYVIARVVRTGFNTIKGSLVKSILFPAPVGIKFYKDSLKFVFVLFLIAAIGMTYCLYMYIIRKAEIKEIIVRTLDIITIVVPPALPAAMTVGIVYSQNRLKKLKIFCISPPKINVCGKIKLACFDKTGTLTHDGLDLYCVVPCVNSKFIEAVGVITSLSNKTPLVQAMATCHSLTRIEGNLTGDPLDLIMFESTKWELEEPGTIESTRYDMLAPTVVKPKQSNNIENFDDGIEIPYEIGIIKQFPFSSSQQCMTVICRKLGSKKMIVFTKGAPERLKNMCQNETLPRDFSNQLAQYTSLGFRVIALAYKEISIKWKNAQQIKRDRVECDLIFLGFLIMRNTLKPVSTPVIGALHNANIRTVMITGDNIMTAISVARDCGMVKTNENVYLLHIENNNEDIPIIIVDSTGTTNDSNSFLTNFNNSNYHFAIDGKTWIKLRTYYSHLLPSILIRATIFARFQPDQKTQLIKYLQKLDYVVSMVGDGANDCGALKAAHVGVSLSQAEASVAAPFTSAINDISCIVHLILEGRCALITSFAVFKYMALYSLIQFFTILILYKHYSILGDFQFLFIDLIITTCLAVTIGLQGPSQKLVSKRPLGSLVSAKNLIPLILQIFVCGLMQILSLLYLFKQPWFEPIKPSSEEIILCWENTVLFTVSCYQYIILATVYSKGKPYRQMLITNFWFLMTTMCLICFTTWLVVCPNKELAKFFEVIYLSPHKFAEEYDKYLFRYSLLLFPIAHLFLAVFIEVFIADRQWLKQVINFITRKSTPKNAYKLLSDLESDFQKWFVFQQNLQIPENNIH